MTPADNGRVVAYISPYSSKEGRRPVTAFEGFVIGAAIATPVVLTTHAVLSSLDARFARASKSDDAQFWVRGDAWFQQWLFARSGTKVHYAKRLLLTLGATQLDATARGRDGVVFSVPYADIHRVSLERFRSRSLSGRGMRVHLKSGSSFCVRAEGAALPAFLASPSITETLASELARLVRERD